MAWERCNVLHPFVTYICLRFITRSWLIVSHSWMQAQVPVNTQSQGFSAVDFSACLCNSLFFFFHSHPVALGPHAGFRPTRKPKARTEVLEQPLLSPLMLSTQKANKCFSETKATESLSSLRLKTHFYVILQLYRIQSVCSNPDRLWCFPLPRLPISTPLPFPFSTVVDAT